MKIDKIINEVFSEVVENYYTIEEFRDKLYKLKKFNISFENKKVVFQEQEFNFKKNKSLVLGSYPFPKLGAFKLIESKDIIKMESDSGFVIDAIKVKKLSNGNFHAVKLEVYKK